MERMAAMGLPAGGGRNELDCSLCDELDHVSLLRERLRSPPWKRSSVGGTDHSACFPWLCCDADLLVHPVLDVPQEDLFKDLRPWPIVLEEGSSEVQREREPHRSSGASWRKPRQKFRPASTSLPFYLRAK